MCIRLNNRQQRWVIKQLQDINIVLEGNAKLKYGTLFCTPIRKLQKTRESLQENDNKKLKTLT